MLLWPVVLQASMPLKPGTLCSSQSVRSKRLSAYFRGASVQHSARR
jgi:hypothetical protein